MISNLKLTGQRAVENLYYWMMLLWVFLHYSSVYSSLVVTYLLSVFLRLK